jgi:proline iminopeptidase
MIAPPSDAPTAGTVSTGDVVLHYTVRGRGAPLLLLAGGPGMSGDYMVPIAEQLGDYRTIVLDQRGTGRSTMARLEPETMTLALAVDDLEALRIHLGLDRWTLVGHSWGGVLAMAYAARHPERVTALALSGSGGPMTDYFRYLPDNVQSRLTGAEDRQMAHWSRPERIAADPQQAGYEHFRSMARSYVCLEKDVDVVLGSLAPEHFNRRTTTLMQQDLLTTDYDLRADLKALRAPVLIVQGRQDIVGETTAYAIRDAFPGSELVWIERCGHFCWLERPRQFFSALRGFLERAARG